MRIIDARIAEVKEASLRINEEYEWITIKDPDLLIQWEVYKLRKKISFEYEYYKNMRGTWRKITKFLIDEEVKALVRPVGYVPVKDVIGNVELKSSTGFKLSNCNFWFKLGKYNIQYLKDVQIGITYKVYYRINLDSKNKAWFNPCKKWEQVN